MRVLSVPTTGLDTSKNSTRLVERHKELFYAVPFLIAIVGLKLFLALFIWRNGYLEHDADGFTRSVRAWEWYRGYTRLEVDAWLPLQFWLNGWLMNFWPDLLRLPRAVNMACSILTTINFFFIGRILFGRLNGYATALLAAIFPWEIWFGMSGMSESLTHFFLSLGVVFFTRWLVADSARPVWLVFASLGFLGATMVRYEAWFYSAVYALVVVGVAWRRRTSLNRSSWAKLLLALTPAFLFIAAWMYASWQDPRLNSPLGFAQLTSEINQRIYGPANSSVSFFGRLFFYPQIFLNLFIPLSVLAIIGSLLLVLRPVKASGAYLALIWGEFALFILTTLPYNNIAPGSGRYPVSNLFLLLPVVVYLFQLVVRQPQPVFRWVSVVAFAGLVISLNFVTLNRSSNFPDGATRQVAQWLKERWDEGYLQPGEKVVLNIPAADGPQGPEFTRAFYALRVLTNRPDAFDVVADPEKFRTLVRAEDGSAPHIWIHLTSVGGSGKELAYHYREAKSIEDYTVARYPVFRSGVVTPAQGASGQNFQIRADEYFGQETAAVWINRPDGKVIGLGNKYADERGIITFNYTVTESMAGTWSITIAGMQSGRRAVAKINVTG